MEKKYYEQVLTGEGDLPEKDATFPDDDVSITVIGIDRNGLARSCFYNFKYREFLYEDSQNPFPNIVAWLRLYTPPTGENIMYSREDMEAVNNVAKKFREDNESIKSYIAKMRSEALSKSGTNTELLVFIQRLEEAFTWIRNIK